MLQIDEYKDTIQSDILKFPQIEEAKNDPQSLIKSIDGWEKMKLQALNVDYCCNKI